MLLDAGIKVLICLAISCVHEALVERIKTTCYTKFATTAEGPKMSQAKQLVEAKFSVRECFTSRL